MFEIGGDVMKVMVDKSIFEQYGTDSVSPDSFHDFLMVMETKKSYALSTDSTISIEMAQSKLDQIDFFFFSGISSRSVNLPTEPHSSDCVVTVGGEAESNNKRFALTEINEYLNTPAMVIVENGMNDGLFVRAIMKHFSPEINFEEQLSNYLVYIDPASGSGASSRVHHHLSVHHNQPKYLRCLAIVDGDKRFPGDTTYGSYQRQQNLGTYLQSKKVAYHILEKRTMENYMPDEVYDSNRGVFGNNWVDAYKRLTEEQKNYYYISGGFLKDVPKAIRNDESKKKDKTQALPVEIQTVFSTVTDADYLVLLNNPHIGGNFKDEFPKFYNDANVTKATLLRRSPLKPNGKSELEEIAEKIRQLL